jgi:hypothetical protein
MASTPSSAHNSLRLPAQSINADRWGDGVRLSDIEPLFTRQACGKKGADVRPDFDWNKKQPDARRGSRSKPDHSPLAREAWLNRP